MSISNFFGEKNNNFLIRVTRIPGFLGFKGNISFLENYHIPKLVVQKWVRKTAKTSSIKIMNSNWVDEHDTNCRGYKYCLNRVLTNRGANCNPETIKTRYEMLIYKNDYRLRLGCPVNNLTRNFKELSKLTPFF